jgi:hypothetical protein
MKKKSDWNLRQNFNLFYTEITGICFSKLFLELSIFRNDLEREVCSDHI